MTEVMTDNEKNKFLKFFSEKGIPHRGCPMCGSRTPFILIEKYFDQKDFSLLHKYPYVSIICSNCGFMSNHNLGILLNIGK
jgi:ribosomal protein S27AE